MKMPPLPELPEPKELYLPTHIQRYYDPADVEDLMRAYAIAYGRAVQQACARVAEDERVDAAATGDATDAAYNIACEQIAAAIRNGVIREGEGE